MGLRTTKSELMILQSKVYKYLERITSDQMISLFEFKRLSWSQKSLVQTPSAKCSEVIMPAASLTR